MPRDRYGLRWRRAFIALAVTALPAISAIGCSTAAHAAAPTCTNHVKDDIDGDGYPDTATSFAPDDNKYFLSIRYGNIGGFGDGWTYPEDNFPTLFGVGGIAGVGGSIAIGDFNGDCFADVAVTGSSPSVGGGAVYIFYGSATGLSATDVGMIKESSLHADAAGIGGKGSLAAADFNHDGFADLAIGLDATDSSAGAVAVVPGSPGGLDVGGETWLTQQTPGIPGTSESGDLFGARVAAGDFNGDTDADLAIGVPGETLGTIKHAGDVIVVPGSHAGPTGSRSTTWSQNTSGVPGTAEAGDQFGTALGAGDITGDGKDDLVIGDPNEAVGSVKNAGSITVLRGSTNGLTASGAQAWSQNSTDIDGTSETGDLFGAAISVGDYNADGHADVAVGAVGESIGTSIGAGCVNIFYGGANGLSATGNTLFDLFSPNSPLPNTPVTATDLDFADEAIAIPGVHGQDNLIVSAPGVETGAGVIVLMHGGASGLTFTESQISGFGSPGDRYGTAVA